MTSTTLAEPLDTDPAGPFDVVIGHLASGEIAVIGLLDEDGTHLPSVRAVFGGIEIHTDGEHLGVCGADNRDITNEIYELPLWAVGRLLEISQAGHLERLIALSRWWAASSPAQQTHRRAA